MGGYTAGLEVPIADVTARVTADTAALLARLTASRASFLDLLNDGSIGSGAVQNTTAANIVSLLARIPAGGLIKLIQPGTILFTTEIQKSFTITAVNMLKSVLIPWGVECTAAMQCRLVLYDATTVVAYRGATSPNCSVSFQLVEFNF